MGIRHSAPAGLGFLRGSRSGPGLEPKPRGLENHPGPSHLVGSCPHLGLALAAALVWLDRHRRVRPPGLFALYVAGYCAFRIVDELLSVDPAAHVFGLRWNLLLAIAGTAIGLAWFAATQRGNSIAAGPPSPALTPR
jgi:hypothetical protein